MRLQEPSRTARAAAFHRAAHQVLEQGRIFSDPLALRILGADEETVAREAGERQMDRRMRLFIAIRHRFAEDALSKALGKGVRQIVVLGAGLDTWAYRARLRDGARTFEVDHPATQAWKRDRLMTAGIAVPRSLTFAPVDFERDTLAHGLAAVGFDPLQPAFFTWLGVVPYLTVEAAWATLEFIGALPPGTGVVFDYSDPPESLSPELRAFHDERAARVAAVGEGFLSYFEADPLRSELLARGFSEVEDLGPREIARAYFPSRKGEIPARGGHVVRAARA